MNIAFKIKSWQLFLLLFLPSFFINSNLTLVVVPLFVLCVISFWSYSIGIKGQEKMSDIGLTKRKSILLKTTCFLMPISWLIIGFYNYQVINWGKLSYVIELLLIPLSLVFAISSFYMIYFVSRTISSLHLGKEVKVTDFILTSIGLVFFPIGLWFIQPKLNKIEGK